MQKIYDRVLLVVNIIFIVCFTHSLKASQKEPLSKNSALAKVAIANGDAESLEQAINSGISMQHSRVVLSLAKVLKRNAPKRHINPDV